MDSIVNKPWLRHYDKVVPHHLEYPSTTFHAFLQESARRYPHLVCTVFGGQTVTYAQMEGLTNRLAAALQGIGVQKGDRIALMLPNSPHFIACFYAVLKCGGIVVAMNPAYQITEVEYQLCDSGARFWMGLDVYAPLIRRAVNSCPLERIVTTRLDEPMTVPPEAVPLADGLEIQLNQLLASVPGGSSPKGTVTPDDVAIFQYTGGTTGVPKGAVGLHRNLVANTVMFLHWTTGLTEGNESFLTAIPLFHVYGMIIALGMGMSLGARLILIPDPRQTDKIIAAIQAYQTSVFPGVPAMYQAILHHPAVTAGLKLNSIKGCISGSTALLPQIQHGLANITNARIVEGYGLSEAPTATHCNPSQGNSRPGSIGLPLPDVDCRIVDLETGLVDLPGGEIGELILRGPQVMARYHNRPEETHQALRDGWLYTGDIAWMDADGFFYLVDRKKEMIKVGGLQVWPREVEEALEKHPAVKEAAAAGVPHPERIEMVKAWVVLNSGWEVGEEDLRRHCATLLADYKTPAEIEFRTDLPRTIVGKVLRRELVRQHKEAQQV